MNKIEKIFEFADHVEKDNFSQNYSEIISYFKRKEALLKQDIIVASYMVYGLMPTMLKNIAVSDDNILTLNEVRNKGEITKEDILKLIKITNNSVVGLSKLLHIIKPEKYAIWDSRIYKLLKAHDLTQGKYINNADEYINYIRNMKAWTSLDSFTRVHKIVEQKLGKDVSALRALELIMYQKSIHDFSNKKKSH